MWERRQRAPLLPRRRHDQAVAVGAIEAQEQGPGTDAHMLPGQHMHAATNHAQSRATAWDKFQSEKSEAGYKATRLIKPMTDGADPNPVRGKLAPAWATNLGACVAGRVGPQEAVAGEHALRPTPSETLVRAGLLPIVDGVLWVAADARLPDSGSSYSQGGK